MDKEANFKPMTVYRNIRTKYSTNILLFVPLLLALSVFIYFYGIDAAKDLISLTVALFIFNFLIDLLFLGDKFVIDTDAQQITLSKWKHIPVMDVHINFKEILGYRLTDSQIIIQTKSNRRKIIGPPTTKILTQIISWLDSQNFPDLNYQEALAEPLLDINGQKLSATEFNVRLKKISRFTNILLYVTMVTSTLPIFTSALPIAHQPVERFSVISLIIEAIIAAVMFIRLNVYLRCYINSYQFAAFFIVYSSLWPLLYSTDHIDNYSLLFVTCVAICSITLTLIVVLSSKFIKLKPAKALIWTGLTLIITGAFSFNLFKYINISYDTSTPQILLSKVDSDCSCEVTVTDAITGKPKNIEISAGDYNVGDTVKISHGNGLLNSPWYQAN